MKKTQVNALWSKDAVRFLRLSCLILGARRSSKQEASGSAKR